jgi:transcriptional regulator with XRE-family HTH domain
MDYAINERLKSFLEHENISYAEYRSIVHINKPQQLSNWLSNREKIPDKYLRETILKYKNLNARWFFTGDGEMNYKDPPAETSVHQSEKQYVQINGKMIDFRDEVEEQNELIADLERSIVVLQRTINRLRRNLIANASLNKLKEGSMLTTHEKLERKSYPDDRKNDVQDAVDNSH